MRREFTIAIIALLSVPFAAAQQPTPPSDTTAPTQANDAVPSPDYPSGIYKVGGRISAPVVKHQVTAQFTDEARRAKYQGICLIGLIVDTHGKPQNVHVTLPLGMGLDEKAIEAVRQYRFKPALKDGAIPVPVQIVIEIDFRLY